MAALRAAEAGWGPSLPVPELDDEEVRRRLAPWPGLRGRSWSLLAGGCRSLNVRVGAVVPRSSSTRTTSRGT